MRRLWFILITVATLATPALASAHESRIGVGAAYSAYATSVQVDLDVFRRIGLQASVGESILGAGHHAGIGGRFYLRRGRLVNLYVGGLYSWYAESWQLESSRAGQRPTFVGDTVPHGNHIGATAGILIRGHRGLGGYIQAETLNEIGRNNGWRPNIGAGIQWWF